MRQVPLVSHKGHHECAKNQDLQRDRGMNAKRKRERINIQFKKKVTRHLEISEGFLKEEVMSDP